MPLHDGCTDAVGEGVRIMAKRYIGDAVITIKYRDRGDYAGTVSAGGHTWRFEDLHAPAGGLPYAYDSSQAYDKMAESAVGFASYYTTYNRGDDTPDWAPSAETADAIAEATEWAQDDHGEYEVRRSAKRSNPPPVEELRFIPNPSTGTVLAWLAGGALAVGALVWASRAKAKAAETAQQPVLPAPPAPTPEPLALCEPTSSTLNAWGAANNIEIWAYYETGIKAGTGEGLGAKGSPNKLYWHEGEQYLRVQGPNGAIDLVGTKSYCQFLATRRADPTAIFL